MLEDARLAVIRGQYWEGEEEGAGPAAADEAHNWWEAVASQKFPAGVQYV